MNKEFIYYHSLGAMRKYKRLLRKYAINVLIVSVLAALFIPIWLELLIDYQAIFYTWFPYVILLYSVLKIFQNNPLITLKPTIFQFKLFSFKQLKIYILFKLTGPSILIGALLFIVFREIHLALVIALLFNVIINYLCFIRFQSQRNFFFLVICSSVVAALTAIYTNSLVIALFGLSLCCLHLLFVKRFNYSILYPYYYLMGKIGEGLLNKDFAKITEAQQLLNNKAYTKNHQGFIKFYESDFYFYGYREYSKMLHHQKTIINLILFMVILNVSYIILPAPYSYGLFSLLIFGVNLLLTMLNKQEIDSLKNSLIFKVNWATFLKSKYHVELVLSFMLFSINFILIRDVWFVFLVIAVALPAINLYTHYAQKKTLKLGLYVLTAALYSLPYLYMGLEYMPFR